MIEVGSFDTIESPNKKWLYSPLVTMDSLLQGRFYCTGYSVGIRALGIPGVESHCVNGVYYSDGIEIRNYVAFGGEKADSEGVIRYNGTCVITRRYFKDIGLVEQFRQLLVQQNHSAGEIRIFKEKIFHQRGSQGAKMYPEFTIPPPP
ncbi:MAG: hypothetical protein JW795_14235 [Chitinivibrionales bacterium]|nr:hypothetical protein [Chitinivibrionales bacterium]